MTSSLVVLTTPGRQRCITMMRQGAPDTALRESIGGAKLSSRTPP